RALEGGLMQGLNLKKDEACVELGKYSCIDKIHLTVLGGNEPFESGQYERSQTPSVLTPVAVDRVVLAACSQRLELDRQAAGGAQVFKAFPLDGPSPDAKQLEQLASELYQRLLARDPEAAELQVIRGFASQGLAADKAALMVCYAI